VQPAPIPGMQLHGCDGPLLAAGPSAAVRRGGTAPDRVLAAARRTGSPRTRSLVLGVLLTMGALAAHLVNPYRDHWLPSCPFHALTGLWCPACGSTRAACALAHGHPFAALKHNVALFAVLALVLWAWAGYAVRAFAPDSARWVWLGVPVRLLRRPWWIVGLVAVFWILRNIPGALEHLLSG